MSIKKGSRTIASSVPVTEWGSVDGTLADQADLKSALDSKAPTYSPTFTGTPIAPTAPIDVSNNQIATTRYVQEALLNAEANLPEQSGNAGKFLTTNGQLPSWANVDALPSQAGNNGKYLITNGTTASWSTLNGVVHLTGNESIDDTKTFTSSIHRTGALSSSMTSTIRLIDTNNKGSIQIDGYYASEEIYNRLRADNVTSNKNAWLDVRISDTGVGTLNVGGSVTSWRNNTASSSTTSNDVALIGWVNDPTKSTNVVHRSGDETIAGNKTFSNSIKLSGIDITSGTESLRDIIGMDTNDKRFGGFRFIHTTGDSRQSTLYVCNSDGTYANGLSISVGSNGTVSTSAPNPEANSNNNSIATTSWVNTKISGVTLNAGTNIEIDNNKNINYTGPRYYRLATRTWTYAQWTQYCERGVTTNISPSYTVIGINAGDLVTVEGICSDRGNASVLAWGIANGEPAAETNNVSVTFLGLNIQDSFYVPYPIKVVTVLPSSPDANTIYIIKGS